MSATLATAASQHSLSLSARDTLPPLQDLDERTACMYVHTGEMRRALLSPGPRRSAAALACRRLMARTADPPVQAFIDADLVPLLVHFLAVPDLVDDALWMLINVAAGTPEQTAEVVRCGAVPPLVRMLSHAACHRHAQHAAWALANLSLIHI